MDQLISQLGIDWHLLLSQAVNFLLLLIILRFVAYQPLLKLLRDRRLRIEEGLVKAQEAERRLHDVDEIGKEKLKAAEETAIGIIKRTEGDAKMLEARLLEEAKRKEAEALKNTEALLRAKEDSARRETEERAAALVRAALVKTVELSPEAIDDALIAKAVEEARNAV